MSSRRLMSHQQDKANSSHRKANSSQQANRQFKSQKQKKISIIYTYKKQATGTPEEKSHFAQNHPIFYFTSRRTKPRKQERFFA